VKGNGDLRASGARDSQFDSGHPDLRPGVVTEACRSDTAAAVVRLHLGPLDIEKGEIGNDDAKIETPASDRFRGRGVKAAQQTFNLAGEGSIPSGPIGIKVLAAAHSVLTRASEGSSPSDPIQKQALVVQRQGLRTRNAATWVRVPPGALEIDCSLTIRS
jgi:hypothetical protein